MSTDATIQCRAFKTYALSTRRYLVDALACVCCSDIQGMNGSQSHGARAPDVQVCANMGSITKNLFRADAPMSGKLPPPRFLQVLGHSGVVLEDHRAQELLELISDGERNVRYMDFLSMFTINRLVWAVAFARTDPAATLSSAYRKHAQARTT